MSRMLTLNSRNVRSRTDGWRLDRVDDAGPGVHRDQESRGLLEDVRQRQDREHPLVGADWKDLRQPLGVRCQVTVGQHRALRLTGRARCEQDLDQVVRTDGRSRQRLGRPREVRDALDEHDRQPQAAGLGSGLL